MTRPDALQVTRRVMTKAQVSHSSPVFLGLLRVRLPVCRIERPMYICARSAAPSVLVRRRPDLDRPTPEMARGPVHDGFSQLTLDIRPAGCVLIFSGSKFLSTSVE